MISVPFKKQQKERIRYLLIASSLTVALNLGQVVCFLRDEVADNPILSVSANILQSPLQILLADLCTKHIIATTITNGTQEQIAERMEGGMERWAPTSSWIASRIIVYTFLFSAIVKNLQFSPVHDVA